MKAIELTGFQGLDSVRVADVEKPQPREGEVLIKVRAAGVNFAELEQIHGRYPFQRPLPGVMGFEAAGEVVGVGGGVNTIRIGDKVVALVSSGGYAEYATAAAELALPIPDGITFAQATSIVVQGLSACALLRHATQLRAGATVLIQAAAGGVGLYLVQLAKIMGARVIALASSEKKLEIVRALGADLTIDYTRDEWGDRVLEATAGKGVDLVLEMASGEIGKKSFSLLAPFGHFILFGAKNAADTITPQQVQQLIYNNQTVSGFNFPTIDRKDVAQCIPELLELISQGKIKIIADTVFALSDVKKAFDALVNRRTIGKVVLEP